MNINKGPIVYTYTNDQLSVSFSGDAAIFCGETNKINGLSILLQQASNIEIYIESRAHMVNIVALKFVWHATVSETAETLIIMEAEETPSAPEKLSKIYFEDCDEQSEFLLQEGFVRLEDKTKSDYYLKFSPPNNYYLMTPDYMLKAVKGFLEGEISLYLLEHDQKCVLLKSTADGVISGWQVLPLVVPDRIAINSNYNVLIMLNSKLTHVHQTVIARIIHVFGKSASIKDMLAQTSAIDAKKDY